MIVLVLLLSSTASISIDIFSLPINSSSLKQFRVVMMKTELAPCTATSSPSPEAVQLTAKAGVVRKPRKGNLVK